MLRQTLATALVALTGVAASGQDDPCKAWTSLPAQDQDAAEMAHVIYRDEVKAGNYEAAFENWQKAYTMAPAADGKRPFHYIDGRSIYLDKYNKATSDEEKEEYAKKVAELYAQERQCYPGSEAESFGRQVYDMFYTMQRPYAETYPVAKQALEVGGDKTDFRVLTPVGYLVSYMFSNKLIEQAEARQVIETAKGSSESNATGDQGQDYTQAFEGAEAALANVEMAIFDCDYFKAKLEPIYRADPDNPEVYQDVYRQLIQATCSKSDPLLAEIGAKDRALKEKEMMENSPMYAGNKLYDEGDVDGAIAKYEQAANAQAKGEAKAALYYRIAQVYRADKKQFGKAREYARKAANARPGWGKPYMFIGDLYAASSASCSTDPFEQRLVIIAALNKYSQAKSDPEVAGEAQKRINKFSGSLPTKEMLFERGIKAGESRSTGCWFGESVSVRSS